MVFYNVQFRGKKKKRIGSQQKDKISILINILT